MPANDNAHQRRKRTLIHMLGVGLAGASIAVAALLPSPAEAATRGDLTTPEPPRTAVINFDPFQTFTDCLAAAAHSDSMYPGIDPSEVNSCLDKHGF